jgi:hypothetical protein
VRTVYVVPHTHWDREWYQPMELFRWRLVQMIDALLDTLESDPEFRCFNLDGQTIVIEDYLELRPENEGRLRRLIEQGRILIGPWWVQPDEFLPSGESHIRSFQKGIRWAERLGGSLRIGHCADQFGHIAQMPQIMAGLGLTSACLWRGVPDSVPGWSFWWESPDGTRLPVLYLRHSYSSGWRIPSEPAELHERARRQERERREGEPALLMNGTDHSFHQADLPALLRAAAGDWFDYRIASLADYEAAMLAAGIDEHVHEGELRSPDRSNVLIGVLSSRSDIKRRDFDVSGALEKYAEPLELLARLHGGGDGLPALRHAWRLLLENSPHDSICGCSIDQTHREMFPRYDRAEQLADEICRASFATLAKKLEAPPGGAVLAFRAVPHAQAVLEVDVPADWHAAGLRLADGTVAPVALGPVEEGQVNFTEEVPPIAAARSLDFAQEGRVDGRYIQDIRWQIESGRLSIETTIGDDVAVVDIPAVAKQVREAAASGLAEAATVTVRHASRRRLSAVLPATATIGVEPLVPAEAAGMPPDIAATRRGIANAFYELTWKKGRLHVRDWQNGLDLGPVNVFVDEGDRGDEYNADILLDAITEPVASELLGIESDAVSACLRYATLLDVPARLTRRRTRRTRRDRALLSIVTTVTLWSGLPRVDFRITVDNTAEDHRLRALFPLPWRVEAALTENQFHVAERPLEAAPWNGTSAERPPTTFPQKTFAAFEAEGQGLAVFNRGLQEGEVVADAEGRQAYALTLLRCIGWLSRPDLRSRRGGAGPTIATFDSQQPGVHRFEYALTTYRGSWREAGVQPMAHSFAWPPIARVTNEHEGPEQGPFPLMTFETAGVAPSALHRSDLDGAPVLRVYSSAAEQGQAVVRPAPGLGLEARLADLLERPTGYPARLDSALTFPLRPWQIATLRFGE